MKHALPLASAWSASLLFCAVLKEHGIGDIREPALIDQFAEALSGYPHRSVGSARLPRVDFRKFRRGTRSRRRERLFSVHPASEPAIFRLARLGVWSRQLLLIVVFLNLVLGLQLYRIFSVGDRSQGRSARKPSRPPVLRRPDLLCIVLFGGAGFQSYLFLDDPDQAQQGVMLAPALVGLRHSKGGRRALLARRSRYLAHSAGFTRALFGLSAFHGPPVELSWQLRPALFCCSRLRRNWCWRRPTSDPGNRRRLVRRLRRGRE